MGKNLNGTSKRKNKTPVTKTKRRIFRKKEILDMKLNSKKAGDSILNEIIKMKALSNKRLAAVTQRTETKAGQLKQKLDTFLRDFHTYSQNYQVVVDDQIDVTDCQKLRETFNSLVVKLCQLVNSLQLDLDCLIKSLQKFGEDDIVVTELQRIYFCCWLCTDYLSGYQGSCDAVAEANRTVTIGTLIEQLDALLPTFYKLQSKAKTIELHKINDFFVEVSDALMNCLNSAIDIRCHLNKFFDVAQIKRLKVEECLKETGLIIDFLCYFGLGFMNKYLSDPSVEWLVISIDKVFKKYQSTFSNYDKSLDLWSLKQAETTNGLPGNSLQFVNGNDDDKDDSYSSISSHGNDAYFDDYPSDIEFSEENNSPKLKSKSTKESIEHNENANKRASLNRSCRNKIIDYSYKQDLRRAFFSSPKMSSKKRKSLHDNSSNSDKSNSDSNKSKKVPKKNSTVDEKAVSKIKNKRIQIDSNGAKKRKNKHILVEFRSQSLIEPPTQKEEASVRRYNSMQVPSKRKLFSPTEWLNSSYVKEFEKMMENQ